MTITVGTDSEGRYLDMPYPYDSMHAERIRAHAKHSEKGSMERKAWDSPRWLPVLGEEFGEVARVICEWNLGNITREEAKTQLHKELTQVGAMAAAWLDALTEVEYH